MTYDASWMWCVNWRALGTRFQSSVWVIWILWLTARVKRFVMICWISMSVTILLIE